jgi:hypothetical protein
MEFRYDPTKGGFQFNAGAPGQKPPREKKPRKAIKSKGARLAVCGAATLLAGFLYFYNALPAINLQAEEFYGFVFLLCLVWCASAMMTAGFQGDGAKGYFEFVRKQCRVPVFLLLALVAVALIGSLTSWVVLRADAFQKLLAVQPGDFAAEVDEISYDQIPMLDGASAQRLGDRKLGELADMVSQFEVAEDYTQINFQGRPVRVTPLRYGDVIKWLNNRANGLPAYLVIDMVTQGVEVVRLNEGMKYTTAEHFSRNLQRHLRFHYPTMMFGEPIFEIDESGTPWWVCARRVKTIGLFGGVDNRGAVLVNAITGACEYCEQAPAWVDHVYSAGLIMQQYNYYGQYHNGFFNSIFGQRDVTVTTAGYNYLAIGDDVWVYTGVTSVGGDESNIGFILSNQRTKETRYYAIAGAEEFSAMGSAEGQVQQMRYTATFPLLLNLADQPTYFMALKDAAQLVKMYAMVNVSQYQIVATGASVMECEANYRAMLAQNGLIGAERAEVSSGEELRELSGVITEIRSAVIGGNTYYYIYLRAPGDSGAAIVRACAAEIPVAPLLSAGDRVHVFYADSGVGQYWTDARSIGTE